jgi:hypothetical protein
MNADLIAKYDGLRVPRYTSFPTAPHFGPQVQGNRGKSAGISRMKGFSFGGEGSCNRVWH